MNNYSIVRHGSEYIVMAGEASVLKVASRRKAVKLVIVAAELLDAHSVLPSTDARLSMGRDRSEGS